MKLRRNQLFSIAALSGIVLIMASCKQDPLSPGYEYMPDMYRGISYETYSENALFSDSLSARKPVKGTIPRFNKETVPFHEVYAYENTPEGYEKAGINVKNPYTSGIAMLEDGKKIYDNFCVHCHGVKGDGNGILVEREKFAGVPSYYGAQLKDLSEGKMYHSIYYGKNMMGAHASQINFYERWAVIEYVKKLRNEGLGVAEVKTEESDPAAL
ncbi:MAG: c-type cytochrome [Flavobacteriales bacterium]